MSDEASGEDFEHEPDDVDRVVLRASAARWVWILIGSMVFFAFGGGMALSERTGAAAKGIGWCLVVVFGFCAVVALRQLVSPGSLTISRTTIDMIRHGRLTTFELADCGRFTTWRNPSRGTTTVVFDHLPDPDTEVTRTNRTVMGGSRSLPDSYGLSAQALADLLNEARAAGAADRRDQ
jgi:hypothetical protein